MNENKGLYWLRIITCDKTELIIAYSEFKPDIWNCLCLEISPLCLRLEQESHDSKVKHLKQIVRSDAICLKN